MARARGVWFVVAVVLMLVAAACSACAGSSSRPAESPASSPGDVGDEPSSTTTSSAIGDPTAPLVFDLDLGAADTLRLHDGWLRLADAGGFDADSACPDALELEYSLEGGLVRMLIVARTDEGEAVTVSWDGQVKAADQRVTARCEVVSTVASLLRRPDRVAPFLAAIDEAVPARMMAVLQPVGAGAICAVDPSFRRFEPDTTGPGRPRTYTWDGTEMVLLEEDDPRQLDDLGYVHMVVQARVPESEPSVLPGGATGTTITWNIRGFAGFALPIPEDVGSTSTQTTLAPSSGRLLLLEAADLLSADVSLRSPEQGSTPVEYPIDLTDPTERESLLGLLNGLEKSDLPGNGGLFAASLRVVLADGQQCSILWFEEQPMELVTVTNDAASGGCRTVVDSPEMSAFLRSYLDKRDQ